MTDFQFVDRLTAGPLEHLVGITDLWLSWQGSTLVLYSADASAGGISAFSVPSDAQAQFYDSESGAQAAPVIGPVQLAEMTVNGAPALVTLGRGGVTLDCFDLAANGQITGIGQITTAGGFDAPVMAMETLTIGDTEYVYASHLGLGGIAVYANQGNGTLTQVAAATPGGGAQGPDLAAMHAIDVAGQAYLVTASALNDSLTSYAVGADGTLTEIDVTGSAYGLGINAPSALVEVTLGGTQYLILAASETDSLTVLTLSESGTFEVVDHVIGSTGTRLGQVTELEAVTVNGQVFLIAGGGDDGLSLLTLLPSGRLLHLGDVADTEAMTLNNVSALAVAEQDGTIEVFASGEGETGITHLRIDAAARAAPILRGSADDTAAGSAADDMISGGAGDDRIDGQDGDDILLDGAGRDTLRGGDGADIFVLSGDGEVDWIEDFDWTEDRIDLSDLGFLRNLGQLTITSTATGATIRFGEEELRITSATQSPLDPALLGQAILFDLSHIETNLSDTPQGIPTQGSDSLVGSAEADDIRLLAGNDSFEGGAGNDTIHGDAGDDSLDGGSGADSMLGGSDNDTLEGAAGNDILRGDAGFDTLQGGAGDDRIDGGNQADNLYGDAGSDTLLGGRGLDRLFGGDGNDQGFGGDGPDVLFGDAGDDRLHGQEGDDRFLGGTGNDFLDGGTENDTLRGEAGFDTLRGGTQEDRLFGDSGNDRLFGGGGFDTLYGGTDRDWLDGGNQADNLYGDAGNDTLFGGGGFDRLFGGDGNDLAYGGDGPDALFGQAGNDSLYGQNGDDRFFGGGGNDIVDGGTGNDSLHGGAGFDTLLGSTGNDTLTGAFNADTFVFADFGGGFGQDTITDFDAKNDFERIDLSRVSAIPNLTDLLDNHAAQVGADVVIDAGGGNTITLLNVSLSDLGASDFVF